METYANQLSIFLGSDQWEAVKKALSASTTNPDVFTPEELSDVFGTLNAMNEIESRDAEAVRLYRERHGEG